MIETKHTTNFAGFSDPNFTPVPDELFDELLATLGGAELKVLLYIIRRTYGFKKRSDRVSKSQLENGIQKVDGTVLDSGTGLSRRAIRLAIDSLVARCILIKHTHQSPEKGFEATEYSLHRRSERASEPTSNRHRTPRVLSTLALGPKVPKPLGRGVPIQETGLQETVRQQTELVQQFNLLSEPNGNISKFRKGTRKNFTKDLTEENKQPLSVHPPTGFASVASVLHEGSDPTGREADGAARPRRTDLPVEASQSAPADVSPIRQEAEPHSPSSGPKPVRPTRRFPAAAESESTVVERTLLLAYIRDYAAEFHDQAPLKSSVTRALNLFQQSGFARERWTDKLYEARNLTKEQAAAIGYQGQGRPRKGMTANGLNKMPYFFGVLACVLGLHDHPAGQHPLPLSPEEFRQQQRRRGEPKRTSLAGKFSHLVQH